MMTVILVFTIFLIISILLWIFFGSKDEEQIKKETILAQSQEKVLRRRASDKEIEKETKEQRRESDKIDTAPAVTDDTLNIPNLTNDIIPETSRFRIYRRTLLNSEIYVKKGHYSTAISLYEGVASRINDTVTKDKIEENIEYLKKFMKNMDQRKSGTSGTDDLKVSMENTASIDRIVSKVSRQLKNEIDEFKKLTDYDYKEDAHELQSDIQDINKTLKKLNREISEAEDKLEILNKESDIKAEEKLTEDIERLTEEIAKKNEQIKNLNDTIEHERNMIPVKLGNKTEIDEDFKDDVNDTKADIGDLKNEVDGIKGFIDSLEEKSTGHGHEEKHYEDRVLVDTDRQDGEVSGLKDHIEALEDKLDNIVNKIDYEKQNPTPIVIDPTPILDILNRTPEKNETVPAAETGKSDLKKTEDENLEKQELPDKSSVEEKTSKVKEEEDIDPNEFELLSEFEKDDIDKDTLSDQEIFEKILRDDRKKKSEEDSNFEIIGDKKNEGDYDIFTKEEEKKKREEEKFYKNFVRTNRKKKRELPILKVSYDFSKLPEPDSLSKEKNILEYSFYKYKPMLEKAGILLKKRKVRESIDYYRVVLNQNIPPEFKVMIKKNINDLTEYLEKYLTAD